jgi:hypothetical protein
MPCKNPCSLPTLLASLALLGFGSFADALLYGNGKDGVLA